MVAMKNVMVHMRRSVIVFLSVAVLLASAGQRQLEAALYHALTIREKMQGNCSGREIYDLLQELRCFPVKESRSVSFQNGYGDGRTYGGNRIHEGIDVMSLSGRRGELTVCSVSEGVVEKMGWLPLGGYRVGIRSPGGFYFYYAHLAEYASGLKQGQHIRAGEALGLMGDTGYGREGTRGKFPVHLHFGIYREYHGSEESLNPYYLLRYLENK